MESSYRERVCNLTFERGKMQQQGNTRRRFLQAAAGGGLGLFASPFLTPQARAAAENAGPMRITKIEAVRFRSDLRMQGVSPNWTWVRLHTDTGLVGTGESYPGYDAHAGALKELSRFLLGKDPTKIERLWQDLFYQISYRPWGGAETRMLTAINIAQWDLLGKAAGLPIYKLLGGKSQEKLLVYNTMNGWAINGMMEYEAPEKITEFLLGRGIKAIKIYPYDRGPVNAFARHGGTFITQAELKQSLDIVKRIRKTAGDEMEIALDLSSKWNLPCTLQIAKSLEPYGILYLEDPMLPDNLEAYARLAAETSIPVCISERLATRFRFREMFELRAVDVVMYDVTWCGGISEAKKISDMADTYKIPTSPHTGGGPILWYASIHTASSLNNFYIMESVYHLYNDLYPHFLRNVPRPVDGYVTAPEAPGLGLELREEAFKNGDAVIETIAAL
ncbi:MAG: twin-arginine translocation signal domain-containing protein [Bryobacteraceae bacterium]|nr:twin-arginine translocation signal domain-containing protein [Bryobacteraceae bacterium]